MDLDDIFSKLIPVITAIGGYFVRMFQSESRKRRMRKQLYREISNNYQNLVLRISLSTSIAGLRQAAPLHFNEKLDISFSVWNFYNDEKRRDMLFELKEAESINRIYDKLSRIGNENLPGYPHVRGKEAAAEVDDRLLDGSLDRKLYRKVSSPGAGPEGSAETWHCVLPRRHQCRRVLRHADHRGRTATPRIGQ